MIPFNIPLVTNDEKKYLDKVLETRKFSGDGGFSRKCVKWLRGKAKSKKVLLTPSGTDALEMAAILADIKPGDEVIMPSFTFVSTANSSVLRGARIVFVDIRQDTMNINEKLIEAAITNKTKAIITVHYASVGCDMDQILQLANKHNLLVIEDAAQAVMSTYNDKPLGGIGHIGCYSFHETKNYNCGEGGAILINDERFLERAEIVWEKGTNRNKYLRGQVDKYTWVDIGSSYLLSEINAAFLYAQFEKAEEVNNKRLKIWDRYYDQLKDMEDRAIIELPKVPAECKHNGHLFYIKLEDKDQRQKMITHLKGKNIQAVFHYIPLHLSEAGKKFGRFHGEDRFTTKESERLLRLPLYYDLKLEDVDYITETIKKFF